MRRRRLLSLRRLAEAAGVATTTVVNIEHGHTLPGFRVIRDLSAALDVDPLEIDEFRSVIEGTGAGKDAA